MKRIRLFMILFAVVCIFNLSSANAVDNNEEMPASPQQDAINDILSRVEKKYQDKGACSRFVQMSTIKAMNISDTATGKLCAKPPGMMRWEYGNTPTRS